MAEVSSTGYQAVEQSPGHSPGHATHTIKTLWQSNELECPFNKYRNIEQTRTHKQTDKQKEEQMKF